MEITVYVCPDCKQVLSIVPAKCMDCLEIMIPTVFVEKKVLDDLLKKIEDFRP